ncbi:MAG: ATP-binding protein [Terricaulis sp.]
MDPVDNPYQPGAGCDPPELAGRDAILKTAEIAFKRIRGGKVEQGLMLTGLRGVGKTVLLERLRLIADEQGYITDMMESPEGGNLSLLLVPSLKQILLKLSAVEMAKDLSVRALRVLKGFSLSLGYAGADFKIKYAPEEGTADSGFLERDLPELFIAVGEAARAAKSSVAILLDEIQYLSKGDLTALVVSAHKVSQRKLPLSIMGAGLPLIPALTGQAKTYSERLFRYSIVGPLSPADARAAIASPAAELGVAFEPKALDAIVKKTEGYPYFLQEWGSAVWNVAKKSPITLADVDIAEEAAIEKLDESFFRMRLESVTAVEEKYMRAMAELGAGPYPSGTIAKTLGRTAKACGVARDSLIKKAMIYSPRRATLAFTVPLFDRYMRRAIPNFKSKAA